MAVIKYCHLFFNLLLLTLLMNLRGISGFADVGEYFNFKYYFDNIMLNTYLNYY